MSIEVLKPRITPATNATPPRNIAVVTTALKRSFLVVAKGEEATCLAKVNPAPLHAVGSVVERPKPFNTRELADFTEHAVQLFEARVVNLKTALAILLMLDSNFGAKPTAKIRLQPAEIGVNR